MVIVTIVIVLLFPAVAADFGPGHVPEEPHEDQGCIDWPGGGNFLAENGTEGDFYVTLGSSEYPVWYAEETVNVGIRAKYWTDEIDDNATFDILVGLDGLAGPDCQYFTYWNSTNLEGELVDPFYYAEASTNLTLNEGLVSVMAQATFGNETLNVSYEVVVRPARLYLKTYVVVPSGGYYQELNWTPTTMLLVNHGGLGIMDLVVDVRYDGRIVGTFDIPYLSPFGNYSMEFTLLPLWGKERIDVVPLSWPGGGNATISTYVNVSARPILDIVSLEVEPESIETGEKVRIEAVVRNRGNATSTGQLVELMVGGNVVASSEVEDLLSWSERTIWTDWRINGTGTFSIAARAEGDEFAAKPVTVEVKAASPSVGTWAVLLSLLLVSLAARRSP